MHTPTAPKTECPQHRSNSGKGLKNTLRTTSTEGTHVNIHKSNSYYNESVNIDKVNCDQ